MKTTQKPNCAFVTIVCDFDYYQCAMQLLSAQRLFHDDYKSYYVVLNGYDNNVLKQRLDSLLARFLSADFANKLIFVPAETLWATAKLKRHVALKGWYVQQVLKLEVAKCVSEPYYIILDAKNFFIKNSSFQDFFTEEGKPIMSLVIWLNGKPQRRFAFTYFGLDTYAEAGFLNTTPYIMITDVVKDLLTYLREQGASLEKLIRKDKTYEFFLYEAFLRKQNRLNDYFLYDAQGKANASDATCQEQPARFRTPYARRLFRNRAQRPLLMKTICIEAITFPSVKVFGLHQSLFFRLSKPNRMLIDEMVTSECFTTEEWEWFFSKQRRVSFIHETERNIKMQLLKIRTRRFQQGVFLLCRALALRL